MKEFLVNNWELIISLCAILLSIVSIIFGVSYNRKTFNYQKSHDKLTTEPHLSVLTTVLKDKRHNIELANNGFGPCHIKSIKYFIENKEYVDVTKLYKENFNELVKNTSPLDSHILSVGNSEKIGAGKSISLLNLNFNKGYDVRHFTEFLKKVEIVITYTNIYNDERMHKEILIYQNAFTGI